MAAAPNQFGVSVSLISHYIIFDLRIARATRFIAPFPIYLLRAMREHWTQQEARIKRNEIALDLWSIGTLLYEFWRTWSAAKEPTIRKKARANKRVEYTATLADGFNARTKALLVCTCIVRNVHGEFVCVWARAHAPVLPYSCQETECDDDGEIKRA